MNTKIIAFPLLYIVVGGLSVKGEFSGQGPTHHPTAKSTPVLFYFCHKNCLNTPISAQSAPIFGILETHYRV